MIANRETLTTKYLFIRIFQARYDRKLILPKNHSSRRENELKDTYGKSRRMTNGWFFPKQKTSTWLIAMEPKFFASLILQ